MKTIMNKAVAPRFINIANENGTGFTTHHLQPGESKAVPITDEMIENDPALKAFFDAGEYVEVDGDTGKPRRTDAAQLAETQSALRDARAEIARMQAQVRSMGGQQAAAPAKPATPADQGTVVTPPPTQTAAVQANPPGPAGKR